MLSFPPSLSFSAPRLCVPPPRLLHSVVSFPVLPSDCRTFGDGLQSSGDSGAAVRCLLSGVRSGVHGPSADFVPHRRTRLLSVRPPLLIPRLPLRFSASLSSSSLELLCARTSPPWFAFSRGFANSSSRYELLSSAAARRMTEAFAADWPQQRRPKVSRPGAPR